MNYYEIVEAAKKMDLDYNNCTDDEFEAIFPPGWLGLCSDVDRAFDLLGLHIDRLVYNKGVLRFGLLDRLDHPNIQVGHWIRDAAAKQSSQMCMITGKRGIRRKQYDGWPCISKEVFIEYANQYEEFNGTETTAGN